jgi:hypothetical protein
MISAQVILQKGCAAGESAPMFLTLRRSCSTTPTRTAQRKLSYERMTLRVFCESRPSLHAPACSHFAFFLSWMITIQSPTPTP